VQDRTTVTLTD